ncbi:MAG: clostripain-related cysteine peptidase [Candidatus Heimdallarchaeota archaeon]|nr:clostripain-related cysteine peptidase [Candidatus Heimdallarchaeota archaeon]
MKEKLRRNVTLGLILLLSGFNLLNLIAENTAVIFSQQIDTRVRAVKNWTVMLYFCADSRDHYVTGTLDNSGNFIHKALATTLTTLQYDDLLPGAESNLNVIALYDYPYSPDHPFGNAKIFSIWANGYELLDELGSTNLGDGQTLNNFINYCKTTFPANNYALVLADHGRGYAGFCYDYHAPHPSYLYALGDCLTLEELRAALSATGGVDVLFLDTCSGGSFELMWQLAGLVDFAVAGETLQNVQALYHSRDILYALSRNTQMTPYELALVGFEKAVNPVLIPQNQYSEFHWPSVALYDLNKIISTTSPTGSPVNFREVFQDFTQILMNEFIYNQTACRERFERIRNEATFTAFSAKSMMTDLGYFINRTLAYANEFYYHNYLESYGNALLYYLFESPDRIVREEYHIDYYTYENLTGFSICFPNTYDMYQEYLYPNFYEELLISTNTYWDDFFLALYPTPWRYLHFPIRDFYEIHLGPIDPTIGLHVIIENYPEEPMHVGYAPPAKSSFSMDIEISVPGAEFIDTLTLGTCTIRIPTASIPVNKNSEGPKIKVVINASSAASASLPVNLTAKHVVNDEIVWKANQVKSIKIGQTLSCEIDTEGDNWTKLIIESDINEEPKLELATAITIGAGGAAAILIITLTLVISFTKKKKRRMPKGKTKKK